MRFLQGASLGVAIGCLVAASADVHRTWAVVLGVVAFVLAVVLTFRGVAGSPRPTGRPGAAPVKGSGPRAATGFFVGRRLGDALAWLAQEHGVSTLVSVEITEESLLVTDLGPRGHRISAVELAGGGFTVDTADLEPEPGAGRGAGSDTSGRFQARDLAPDVLDRVLQRAGRAHPATWTDVAEPTARIEHPDRLRGEVTVQLVNGATGFEDETLWASAAGDLLYLQRAVA